MSFNDIFVMTYFFRLLSLRSFNFVLLSCTQPVFFIAYKVLVSSFTDICGFLIYTECARIFGGFIHAVNYKFLNIRTRCPTMSMHCAHLFNTSYRCLTGFRFMEFDSLSTPQTLPTVCNNAKVVDSIHTNGETQGSPA